ncbi:MAG: ABC transporter substrate-binding protein [Verrucomicrobiales bacterium]
MPRLLRPVVVVVALGIVCGVSFVLRKQVVSLEGEEAASSRQRLVALAPSIVEVLYQLGLEDRLVGVSRYSSFPPEAVEKPVVGGYLDLDFEAILRLRADSVILLEEQAAIADRLGKLGIHTLLVEHENTDGILRSIQEIGEVYGKPEAAEVVIESIRDRLQNALDEMPTLDPVPSVLVCLDRDLSVSSVDRVVAAGNHGVHQEYLAMLGLKNAYEGRVSYPVLSREKLVQLDPDVIIDLVNREAWEKYGDEALISQWALYRELKAVREGRVYVFHEHKHMIPGPRFVDTIEALAELFREGESP